MDSTVVNSNLVRFFFSLCLFLFQVECVVQLKENECFICFKVI